jgi:hydrogenase nickel incorporation protein HypA/HybF
MHELSLCESVLEIIERQAQIDRFKRVKTVVLEIGVLSCVEPESMQFCFDSVMQHTIASGAHLDIVTLPGLGFCRVCQKQQPIEQRYDPCPECGRLAIDLIQGTEMRVKELEVE